MLITKWRRKGMPRSLAVMTLLMIVMTLQAGVPVVRSFPRSLYGAGAQNWAVAQDSLGRMYFGNRYGLLTYNSREWQLLRIPNFSTVRSILLDDEKGRIYVGASDDFGYFEVEQGNGRRVYHSLTQTIQQPDTRFTEIWNILRDKRNIWFQSDFHIFRYNGSESVVIPFDDKITSSAFISGRLYAGLQAKGLVMVNDRSVVAVAGTETLHGKRIVAILPGRDSSIIVLTAFDGLYEVKNGSIKPLDWQVNRFLKDNQAFCGAYNPRTGQYAFGTVNAGAVIVETATSTPLYINVAAGMQDNTVLNLGFDRDANLWMALDNGIDYAVTNSAVNSLPFPGSIYGAGYASLLRGSDLYLGTNRGLFSFEYPYPAVTHRETSHPPLIKGQIWSMDTVGNDILVSGDAGLFYGSAANGFRNIEGVTGTWSVQPVPGHDDLALASCYEGFLLLERTQAGTWQVRNRIAGRKDAAGKFKIDSNGDVWIAHWMRGIYRLRLNGALTAFSHEDLFTSKDGLPTNRNNLISVIDGRLIFSTEGGFYRFNAKTSKFEPHEEFNTMFRSRRSSRLYQADDREVWSVSPDHVWRASLATAGGYDLDTTTYQPLGEKLIPGFDNLQFIAPGRGLMSSQDGFYEINGNYTNPSPAPPTLFISQIFANQDSLIYTAPLASEASRLQVPFELNSLKFEFVTPEYRANNAVRYSFFLESYDNDWSSWSRTSSKEYTQLSEGTYTLHVRAHDAYSGETAETAFEFTVNAPWYRSLVAKIIYFLMFCLGGYLLFVFLRDSSRRAAREVERQKEEELEQMKRSADEEALRKDYEIAHLKSQQLEHDIKHKSEELSNITMNVIRKNEILLDISGKLNKLQESLPDDASAAPAGKQLQKIQKLIQDNISHDDDWRSFTQNFDIVYENYTKRLVALHPELNASDQRICCYLKMGLSSKEIAPLFNISYRSVEMTRYRLRKKMGLSREINLAEYLQKI